MLILEFDCKGTSLFNTHWLELTKCKYILACRAKALWSYCIEYAQWYHRGCLGSKTIYGCQGISLGWNSDCILAGVQDRIRHSVDAWRCLMIGKDIITWPTPAEICYPWPLEIPPTRWRLLQVCVLRFDALFLSSPARHIPKGKAVCSAFSAAEACSLCSWWIITFRWYTSSICFLRLFSRRTHN